MSLSPLCVYIYFFLFCFSLCVSLSLSFFLSLYLSLCFSYSHFYHSSPYFAIYIYLSVLCMSVHLSFIFLTFYLPNFFSHPLFSLLFTHLPSISVPVSPLSLSANCLFILKNVYILNNQSLTVLRMFK